MSENEVKTKEWLKILRSYKEKYKLTDSLIELMGIEIAKRYEQLLDEAKKQVDKYISTSHHDNILVQIEDYETIKSFSLIDNMSDVFDESALGSKLWTIPLIAGGVTAAVSTLLAPIGLLLGAGGLIEGFRILKRRKSVEMLLEELKPVIKKKLLQDVASYVKESQNSCNYEK